MKRFLSVVKSEIHHFLHEPAAILIMIIGVVVYSLFYAMPYSAEVVKNAPVAVIDLDRTNLSREFTRNLNTTDYVEVVSTPTSMQDAQKDFYKNKTRGIIIIPKDFEQDILRGKQSTISFYADTSYLIIYKSVYTGTLQTAVDMGAKIEVAKLMKSGVPKQMAMNIKQPFEFVQVPLYNAAGGYETYVYPSILVMILHQTLIIGLALMQGTRNELRENYCKKKEVIPYTLFARCTTYVLLYLFYSIIIFLIFPAIFVYPMSYNIIPLFALLTVMFYAASFFSHTISYFFKTRESALLILVVTSLIFIFLPGFIWPKESIPACINVFAQFIPATSGVDGIIKINQMGGTFWNIRYNFLWLLILCLVYFVSSCKIMKLLFKEKYSNSLNS